MDTQMDIKVEFACNICNKDYSSYKSLWNHNKKFHTKNVVQNGTNEVLSVVVCDTTEINNKHQCKICNKIFNDRSNKYKHEKICKNKINNTSEIESLKNTINEMKKQFSLILQEKGKIHPNTLQKIKEENINLKKELKNINLTKIKEDIDDIKNNPPINNQLINIISDKNKKIEELNKNQQIIQPIIEKQITTFESLTLNDIVITSRSDDNFINATLLCQAGGKQFNDWYRLNNTKNLVEELSFN